MTESMHTMSTPEARTYELAAVNAHLGDLAHRLQIVFTEFTPEKAVATMPVNGNTQPFGQLHGGASAALGETLGSMHANYFGPEGHFAVGVDINATHTGTTTTGTVTAECRPIHMGRSLAVHEIVILAEDGRRCSTVRITNLYRQK